MYTTTARARNVGVLKSKPFSREGSEEGSDVALGGQERGGGSLENWTAPIAKPVARYFVRVQVLDTLAPVLVAQARRDRRLAGAVRSRNHQQDRAQAASPLRA